MQLDPSSSSICTPTNPSPSEQPLQLEVITYMDNDLFKAAEKGDMELFNKYQGDLNCLVDRRQNTALHIYSRSGGCQVVKNDKQFLCFQKKRFEREFSNNFVKQLVDKCPSLLLQPNDTGEVPLHVAAKHGHSNLVKVLIELAKVVPQEDLEKGLAATCGLKQMLRMSDKDGNTAMHKAVESGDLDAVRLLMKELDTDFSANKSGETPLYIAVKRERNRLVAEILDNCKSIDYGGPNGRTALHAAVMVRDSELVRKLIEANKHLTKETDDDGLTPLHYAASFGFRPIVKVLLESDTSAAYLTDKDRGMTALHMAAWGGERAIMEDIISHCPDCCEIVDKRGWNFLHFTVVTLDQLNLQRFLISDKNKIKDLPIRNLINEKDVTGITPFHVLIFGNAYRWQGFLYKEVFNFFERHGSEKRAYVSSSPKTMIQVQKLFKDTVNEAKKMGIPIHGFFQEKAEEEKVIPLPEVAEKARESHLVVAALIATVTFAAAYTVPGGYRSEEQGTATLSRDSAFKVFVITDTMAFVSSLSAIFIYFISAMLQRRFKTYLQIYFLTVADLLTICATAEMVVAFSTGTSAVLESSSRFAIATLSLGLSFFPLILYIFWCIWSDFPRKLNADKTRRAAVSNAASSYRYNKSHNL